MSKIKYAMIGFGGIAENRLAKEGFACDKARFEPLPDAQLIGVTDINPERENAAAALGLKWYDNADDIFADPAVDAVFVATNNLTHASLAKAALNAGKHVIVEKPMATKATDAAELVSLAQAKKLSLAVDHMMIYNVYNAQAKKMVDAGELGTVNDACFHMEFAYGYDPAEAASWRCASKDEIGGPIGDVASHCFYMAEYVFNSTIEELSCVYYPKTMPINVEDGAYIKFKLANGLSGSVKVGFNEFRGGLRGALSNFGYEIYGSDAVLRGYATMFQLSGHDDEPIKLRLELDKFERQEQVKPDGPVQNIYQALVSNHAQSILSGQILAGNDAVHNLKLVEAAHQSAMAGGKIVGVK